jgi:diguanylate cyclase (GGDEF)-like protein
MSDPAPIPLAREALQSRVLIIDDGHGLPARIESLLQSAAMRVETRSVAGYLMALGELGVSDDAPHAIIGPLDGLNGDLSATAAALHELAPRTRLIAVTESLEAEAPRLAVAAGFDECLTHATCPADLRRTLALHRDDVESPGPIGAASAPAAGLSPPPLDTAILEQMLSPRGEVQGEALRFIGRHSGITGVALSPTAPDDHAAVEVTHLGQSFGQLHAPSPASSAALEPWAAWLSRWLVLHRQQQDLWFMAMRDELTGAWNRRYFQRFLSMSLARAERERSTVTLLLFDVDDFKQYNDRYGHAAGDDILRETVSMMKSAVREHDVVARIGGDEFAVIFWDNEAPRRANSRHPADIAKVVERFRKALAAHKFPKLTHEALGTLTISGGLASYPWDGQTPDELLAKADAMAFQSKQQGKNAITYGPH